jgi:hypothetical protein
LGYALENRIVISRVFSELYHQTQIRRLAPFFQTFHSSFVHRASLRREDPGIVLLSPGPDSRIYFEHALLSRYLGYPLVEGQDLTVRNGEVFLKKLAGLEPVEAIFRHTEDAAAIPFALRRETATGVSGLVQVSREQNIDLVNPIGSGFAGYAGLGGFPARLVPPADGSRAATGQPPGLVVRNRRDSRPCHGESGSIDRRPGHGPFGAGGRPGRFGGSDQAAPHAFMAREPVCSGNGAGLGPQRAGGTPLLARIFVRDGSGVHRHARGTGHHRRQSGDLAG